MSNSSKKDNITLSISSKNIPNCKKVAQLMVNLGIVSSITPNYTVLDSMYGHYIENGCKIFMGSTDINDIRKVWNPLKKEYNLNCAHLHIKGKYSGCIYDFFRDSNCPG